MNSDDVRLSSVNWEHGMLLTPEHFLKQERYFDSAILWMLRFSSQSYGLVGGGPRLPESEQGAVRQDPIVVIDEDDESVSVSVTQCRGLTTSGCIVDIDPAHALQRRFAKSDLEGISETGIFILCAPHDKETDNGPVDEFNPQMQTERRSTYRISLAPPADAAPYALSVARLRRSQYGSGFERDPDYIPSCAFMLSFSQLTAAWREIVDETTQLAGRYTELHRAMQEFVVLFKERGIETELDRETLSFVGRTVVALQNCVYDLLDPAQSPQRFFGNLKRFFHSAAVYLDLSPPVRQYFETLKESGETEFVALLEQQKKALRVTPKWRINEDLASEVRAALQSLAALRRLERALEGKYIDFRTNPMLEAMNFIFDRGGKVLYKLAAKPSRVQGFADELTVNFAQLRLEGREKYRLVLIGEQDATFEPGTLLNAEIRINEGSGHRRESIHASCECLQAEQCNFEFDFEAPDVPTITDLRVSIAAHHPVRTALLFVRQRFYASSTEDPAARPMEPEKRRTRTQELHDGELSEAALSGSSRPRRDSSPPRSDQAQPPTSPQPERPAPWEAPRRGERSPEPERPKPRRRRLE